MSWPRMVLPVLALVIVACGPAPSPSASGAATAAASASAPATPGSSAATSPLELTSGSGPLAAGSYTRSSFRPPVVFAIEDGWSAGEVTDGFFDVQQEQGTPDVIAVRFAHVDGIAGEGASIVPAATAADAVKAIHENPALTVVDESASRMSGVEGLNVIVENQGSAAAPVMRVGAGTLSIDPGRKLWISMFDTADGLLAVMVGGSATGWERALTVAEPVLESVVIGGSAAASPSAAGDVVGRSGTIF